MSCVRVVDHRDDDQGGAREPAAQVGEHLDAGQAGETQVEDQRIGLLAFTSQAQDPGEIAGLLDPGLGQQALEDTQHALAKQRMIIGDDDAASHSCSLQESQFPPRMLP